MNNIDYKKYKDSNYEQLFSFFKIIDHDFLPSISDRSSFKKYIRDDIECPGIVYLAWSKDKLVGMIELHFNYPEKNECYINTIAVHPEYRKNKIGSHLMKLVLKKAKEVGFKNIRLRTWSSDKSALGLYNKFGFTVDYVVENDRGKGIDSIYLKKSLIKP